MVEFKLPDVGEGMHEGEIIKWLIKEGESVTQDQPIVEVQTDKVNAELTAPATGVVKKILFTEGDIVEVGTTIFTIQEENDISVPETFVIEKEPPVMQPADVKVNSEDITSKPHLEAARVLATPYVRQMAREMKVDIQQVKGSGPAGRIIESDLQQFIENNQFKQANDNNNNDNNILQDAAPIETVQEKVMEKGLEERILLKGIRKKIAEHMVKSVSTIPHVTHVDELEMDRIKELKDQLKTYSDNKDIKLTFLPFFVKAIVIALKEFKTLNASIDEKTNEMVLKNYYHIGIATNTNDGLIVPVIKNADQKTIFQLADEIRQMAIQAREGKLSLEQITGSTFTISNVGPIGGLHATPIINYPEAAILALHKMEPRMVVRDLEGVIRLMMNMSLSFDHRLIDGVTAVRFTNRIKELLENPILLVVEMR
ncbi:MULTISPECIES: dihydrolipoamide acetyltransferase family protein [unclassified Peribacillus]|uniref:dihydrolipoamide acetyltransferase family protein n=1 Tax=unclassified Peribacillus TaxID=2675266 RepID=UPI0019129770|nr:MULTISPECIES: dihydrolipoamide acetyltransferase family protein [unclassified Peribacillus]MBK5445332.1 2-oxo acid dehydrogenase subunit E2 [Peribacillus sp. TH24]MBK5459943.1 2-oxo acid dehydrogenase subunit E2 [Peribacillus sp. TH27]MBK5498134.1 2-oxo acid dehydrogenase subunit E2 [Peribacillus sp. TH14]WMX56747.1 dihydrolipoamide acetyltransferase family protein [Peribacillus sp. R9-11]